MSVTLNKNPSSRVPSTSSPATKDLLKKLFEQVRNKTSQTSQTTASKSRAVQEPTNVYNDIFKSSGSFTIAGGKVEILWRQANFIKGMKYPPKSKAISYEVYQDGKKKNWPLNGPAYLDSNGRVHLPVRSPNLPRTIRSEKSFLSDNFNTLVKAIKQMRAEAAHIKKHGLASLPGAVRNKKGQVVTTRGALVLAALIRKMGAKKIARAKIDKTSALAIRTFDNIQRLLRMKGMEAIVHRAVEFAGLEVIVDTKTRGRRLGQGESSAMGAARGRSRAIDDLANGAPRPPWNNALTDLVFNEPFTTLEAMQDHFRPRALELAQNGLNDPAQREHYANAIADYFLYRTPVYDSTRMTRLQRECVRAGILELLTDAAALRAGQITRAEFERRRKNATRFLYPKLFVRVPFDNFMRALDRLPGFQTTNGDLQTAVNAQLEQVLEMRRVARQMEAQFNLPIEVARIIFLTALAIILSPSGL